jgi:hypothetical protein
MSPLGTLPVTEDVLELVLNPSLTKEKQYLVGNTATVIHISAHICHEVITNHLKRMLCGG